MISLRPAFALLPLLALAACSGESADGTGGTSRTAGTADAAPSSPAPDATSAAASGQPASSGAAPSGEASSSAAAPTYTPEQRRAAAASLLMPGVVSYDDALAKLQAGVGGIFLPSWANPELLTTPGRDIAALRAAVGRDFEVAIDFEGGRVQRFSEILGAYPAPAAMAASGTPEQVEDTGLRIGQSLAAHGITVDFAPVLDVDGNGLTVVGDRSFSTDPAAAATYGAAFARGLQRAGVRAVFKHFPGHGRASGDTHAGAAVTPPLDQLYGWDLLPYAQALPAAPGADVMLGHLVVPGLGDGTTPASLNPAAYDLLRNRYGFAGVAYTDDLTGMRAITDRYAPDQAAVAAIAAGADMPLWSTSVDINAVIDAVDFAAASGAITPERFAAAVAHVRGRLNS